MGERVTREMCQLLFPAPSLSFHYSHSQVYSQFEPRLICMTLNPQFTSLDPDVFISHISHSHRLSNFMLTFVLSPLLFITGLDFARPLPIFTLGAPF